ncbi:hypothetical protein FA95DRAFT_1181656 [Auriscalpium vulgare]|uniref:Uncharacterized protein n=1 Tax=Auriscalpium vulgare TaxID=40419 RepID=A0ACB8SAH1_9AGAM|nr:hypothetical protein FA95DRAFT_1181656 [Auriscalpium vulgare]
MSGPDSKSATRLLARALQRIRSTPPRIIASPPTQPRRAAVALIIRVLPPPNYSLPPTPASPPSLADFFDLEWVTHPSARPEILFLRRTKPDSSDDINANTKEAHVAFPGGRMEEGDEGGLYTAMRQTWEEIGLDLAESDYTCIGQLDDREITTSLGKRLLMILSPFVFLQLSPAQPPTDPIADTTLHWVPLASLYPSPSGLDGFLSQPVWSTVTVDTASRLAPRHSTALRLLMRALVGSMQFPALVLAPGAPAYTQYDDKSGRRSLEAEAGTLNPALHPAASAPHPRGGLKLWGLSLGMALDLLAYMAPTPGTPLTPWDVDALMGVTGIELDDWDEHARGGKKSRKRRNGRRGKGRINAPPSLTAVFPRFSYPDVNFWIWVFGKRYRQVIRGWEASIRAGGTSDRRINWTGAALTTFYAAVRKALVVVLVLRAIGVFVTIALSVWWVFR